MVNKPKDEYKGESEATKTIDKPPFAIRKINSNLTDSK